MTTKVDIIEKLKYAHRFAKRDNTYDSEYVQSTIENLL